MLSCTNGAIHSYVHALGLCVPVAKHLCVTVRQPTHARLSVTYSPSFLWKSVMNTDPYRVFPLSVEPPCEQVRLFLPRVQSARTDTGGTFVLHK